MEEDPSEQLLDEEWEKGRPVGPGVRMSGTIMWRSCSAFCRKPGDTNWTRMKETGKIQADSARHVYTTGGEIRVIP